VSRTLDLAAVAALVLIGLVALVALIGIGIGAYVAAKRTRRMERYNDDVAEHLRDASRRDRRP
jgi:hypothetical protein